MDRSHQEKNLRLKDHQAYCSLLGIDQTISKSSYEQYFSRFFFYDIVFMVVCLHYDRFKEVYNSLHPPYVMYRVREQRNLDIRLIVDHVRFFYIC